MKPIIQQVIPLYPSSVHIQWTVEDKESAFSGAEVLRSESPQGPFTSVVGPLDASTFFYVDTEPELSGLNRPLYYIIKANSIYGPDKYVLSEAKTFGYELKGHRAKIARKARRDLTVTLSRLNGVQIAILKRKTFGPRCTYCFNPETKDTLFSSCPTCYGSSFLDGYHDPIYAWGKLDPVTIQRSLGSSGNIETGMTGLTIVDYPRMSIDDVIVELKTNRRFKVQRVMTSESSRVVVHQDLQVSELSRSSVEYSIPVELSHAER